MDTSPQQSLLLVATTSSGLEEVLAEELRLLGAHNVQVLNRAVSFTGGMPLVYTANLWCRTAFHILRVIDAFTIQKQQDLYDRVHEMPWENWLDADKTLAIHAVAHHAVFTHTNFVEQRTKDAIVDRFRGKYGRRPSVDLESPYLRIHVHLTGDKCQVLIDSSGESLHKRGYRKVTGTAPLNEVLAAGLVMLSGWDRQSPLFDPMCGSGTILIEAALIALGIPAQKFRKTFAFQHWPGFDATEWNNCLLHAPEPPPAFPLQIQGADIAEHMVRIARQNIHYAGLERYIALSRKDFRKSPPPSASGTIITNPPYGERLPVADLQSQYIQIGDVLKNLYAGWSAWLLASDKQAVKFLGLKPSKKITVFNGPLECKYVNFEVFKGSRKEYLEGQ